MRIELIADDGEGNHAAIILEADEGAWMKMRPGPGIFRARRVVEITIQRDDGSCVKQPYLRMGDYR